ncbi:MULTISPECIES: alpha/beta fold hydrolase [Pseudoalteromonas]|uniref:thioesterase II family protein n=1 Tax=Pseudoalteromonas TaxID=53246 RepID=UPI001EF5BE80|nr:MULTISPECIES: alpha/beta fold hydrolase [Pseudoalteromonas]MCG7563242.1 thioesterase domain-containing protein [Pseudoalteromonas sp. McH1-42]MEC4090403.1 alpha/beta fold hydrolase [Pseudoalteromonas rubra]
MNSKLFVIPKPNPNAKLRLFCFPYAGGSPAIYMPWNSALHPDVELVLLQFPGRGARMAEPAHVTMQQKVDELLAYQAFLTEKPYVLMGHSLGSRVIFEVTKHLVQQNAPLPRHLIASGSRAPHTSTDKKRIYNLPHDEFVEELYKLNGTPKELLEHKELMELLLPLLRADFQIAECYQAQPVNLPCPITVFHGYDDIEISAEQLHGWQDLSEHKIDIHYFNGGHFFINQCSDEVISQVNQVLHKIL